MRFDRNSWSRLRPFLALAAFLGFAAPVQAQTDLLISEYVEGSSYNKALEIYNGTGAAIDCAGLLARVEDAAEMLEDVPVPSQDQLTTTIDMSIQFRIIGSMAPDILKNTGTGARVVDVHLTPMARSLLREQGKGIQRAEAGEEVNATRPKARFPHDRSAPG